MPDTPGTIAHNLRLILLQARKPQDPMAAHERRCVATQIGMPLEHIEPIDVTTCAPSRKQLTGSDGVIVGGSGDYYISKGNMPRHTQFLELMDSLVAWNTPTFGICFGYQALVQALGGEIIHDPPNTEVGSVSITLTASGRADPLLGQLPKTFHVQTGHKDRARTHPKHGANLAGSSKAPLQALRIENAPIWAVQFHPELTRLSNMERFERYLEGYAHHMNPEQLQEIRASFVDSHAASSLLRRFVGLVFG